MEIERSLLHFFYMMQELLHVRDILDQHGYELKQIIGQGGFASVYLCHSLKYDQDFAVKKAIRNRMTVAEYSILISLTHPNIIKLFDFFEDESSQYFVMEYCPYGTFKERGKMSYDLFVYYSKQMLEALDFCHSKKIAHRDIKPQNIFIDQYDNCKLADFGIAKIFGEEDKSDEKCGSIMYFAPEMFQYREIDPFKADIWALGVTFFTMVTGKYPFKGNSPKEIKQYILLGDFNFDKYEMDSQIRFLITKMTQMNVNLRPSTSKLLKLPIFNPLEADKRLNFLTGKPCRNTYGHEFHRRRRISSHRSMTFEHELSSSSEDEQNTSSPLTKLHSYKSFNSSFAVSQRLNLPFQSSKLV